MRRLDENTNLKCALLFVTALGTLYIEPISASLHSSFAVGIGKVSFLVSMLYLLFGRGVLASNIGMAFMTFAMFLLLI